MVMGMEWDACEFHEDAFCLDDDTCASVSEYKWYQPPDPTELADFYYGWDEWSAWETPQIIGDDWVCSDDEPVAVVEWWGSYQGWSGTSPAFNAPSGFRIGVWTDVPAGTMGIPFSHPGVLLQEWYVSRTLANEEYVGRDYYPGPTGVLESAFHYTYDVPDAEWFHQDPTGDPTVYWLTIAAIYDETPCACSGDFDGDGDVDLDDYNFWTTCNDSWPTERCHWIDMDCSGGLIGLPDITIFLNQFQAGWPDPQTCTMTPQAEHVWGWMTRPRDPLSLAPDRAVRMWRLYETEFTDGEPIGASAGAPDGWDTAFELSSMSSVKWSQPPVPHQPPSAYRGWDELSVWHVVGVEPAHVAADDWVCRASEPVTDIHWWGSYLDWRADDPPPDAPDHFHITIWTDVPAGVDESFSHPGTVVHEIVTGTGLAGIVETFDGWDVDPVTGALEACFKYDLDLPQEQWFYQDPAGFDTIYWISIAACYEPEPIPSQYAWGWTTRERSFASAAPDAAVRVFDPQDPTLGSVYAHGEPIPWPSPIESWADMAFLLRNDCAPKHYFGDVTDVGPDCPPPPANTDRSGCDQLISLPDIVYVLNAFGEGDNWPECYPNADLMSAGADPCALDGAIALPDIVAVLHAFAGQFDCRSECPCPGPTADTPVAVEYAHSDCLRMRDAAGLVCPGPDEIEVTVEAGSIRVVHTNAIYNCCPDDIVVSATVEGAAIHMNEEEIVTVGCFCVCCYEVESTVSGLGSGLYTFEYCWGDLETDPECYTDVIVMP